MSTSHFVNKAFCQQVILSISHFVNKSFCQHGILFTSYFYKSFLYRSFCLRVILLMSHFVDKSLCRQVIMSTWHSVYKSFFKNNFVDKSLGHHVIYQDGISPMCHFCQLIIFPMSHFIHMPFGWYVIRSTCHVVK